MSFLPGIHALRAIAATLVVVEHAAFASNSYSALLIIPHFSYGRVGVILFFAISGFVIALQRTKPPGVFVLHRLLRIYPSYWLATGLAFTAMLIIHRPADLGISAVLLYPSSDSAGTLWIPYWTLAFEMTFYTLAAVAFRLRASDRVLTVLAFLWIVAVLLFGADATDATAYEFPGRSVLLSPAVQVFPMGLICGIHFERLKRAGRWPYLLGSLVAFSTSIFFADLSIGKLFTLGITSSCLILAVADLDISRVVKTLGDASYGIYLLHFPAMILAAALWPSISFWSAFAVGLTSGAIFGLIDHALYQQAIMALRKPSSWQERSPRPRT